ncbi:MAG: arginine--tRNA ligase, partial [Proteobacteria bacterium]|nr:arginine--tRNA ligase [Pseudomonadota bacterium]
MIKTRLKKLIDQCFEQGVESGFWSAAAAGGYSLDAPKHAGQGDLATNLAMVVAGKDKKNPRTIAAQLVEMLAPHTELLEKVEIAGPGFVNCYINQTVWQSVLPEVCSQDVSFGRSTIGQDKKVLVEFVSANPTGPLSVGHGRQAVLGDAIAGLLAATGHQVTREYYYNDAGRQMRVLGESTRARYLEALGLPFTFPEDGYQGQYIRD